MAQNYLDGTELISLTPQGEFKPMMKYEMTIQKKDGSISKTMLTSRVDTADELLYIKNGGILQYVLRNLK